MKNMVLIVLVVLLSAFALASLAQAEAAYVPAKPYMDGEECVIPPLPPGAQLMNVQIYNDETGMKTKNLGPVPRFPLKPCESTNFTWKGKHPDDGREGIWFSMITPRSIPGKGLKTVCFEGPKPDCKYERPCDK